MSAQPMMPRVRNTGVRFGIMASAPTRTLPISKTISGVMMASAIA